MFDKAVSYGLLWDFAVCEAVGESQRWILSAMQSHGPELVTMLWRILGNEQDVCDAYQDTFLQLAHYEGGRKPEYVKAYIFRVANNAAISMLRRRIAEKKRVSMAVIAGKIVSSPDGGQGSPANELDSRCLQETLRCCIARLPEHLRNVITLRELAGLSYAQIGRILGISAATARVYRCKAIQLLAVWMGKEG
jgi:RNA polymerase sigma-70 factor (ECF subfamily)